MKKPKVSYTDTTVGSVEIARATAVKIVRDWKAAGHIVRYLRTPSGLPNKGFRWAFYGIDNDHYIGWSR